MKQIVTIYLCLCVVQSICTAREIYVHANSQADAADGSKLLPFRTVSDALNIVKSGDTVIVHGGLYRESVRVPGGQPDMPVSLKAADDERVILSGAIPVKGWKKHDDKVYVTELDFRPERLLVDYRPQPVAREPNEGWWVVTDVEDLTIIDEKHLKGFDHDYAGGEAYIWTAHNNSFYTVPVSSIDDAVGRLGIIRKSKWMELHAGDQYYLRNHASLIDFPGEWAVHEEGGASRIYLQPTALDDLNAVDAPRESRCVLGVYDAKHVRISGLEVVAAAGNGIQVERSEDVVISDCISHSHGGRGILLRDVKDVTVRHNVFLLNDYGVTLYAATNVIVEENEIAHNSVDGLVVSWNSADVTVSRNYIHHHLLWGHPDNIQLFRGVKNIRIIDNLLIASGQSIMMAETSDGLLKGNMIVGAYSYSVIFGHGNAENYCIYNNTIAFSGYGCMSLTARDYDVRENIFMTGNSHFIYTVRGVEGYVGDYNLLFNAPGLAKKVVVDSDKGRHRSLVDYQRATGYDRHSIYHDPQFRNSPNAFAVLDDDRLNECTRSTFYLRKGSASVRIGDVVEVDFDGVARRVVSQVGSKITIVPELSRKPLKGCLICNWGSRTDITLDLRLASDSPGAKLGASGYPIGSTIDITAYQRGDFNADGKRDLPRVPLELEPESYPEQGTPKDPTDEPISK